MSRDRPTSITFGPFRFDPARRVLTDADRPVRIGPRSLELLSLLLECPGRLYSREELEARAWPRAVVEESSLRVHISALRRTLGDGQAGSRYIVTVPGRGYAFVGEVRAAGPAATDEPTAAPHHRPPAPRLSSPIGRGHDIARIGELLLQERLVSIVGAGGLGKTTVALAVADNMAMAFRHGVCFVDLSSLSDAALVAAEIGQSCGIGMSRSDPWGALQQALHDQQRLIVLDNCEHVIDAAATAAERILRTCPQVRILATSREPLEAEAEWVDRLPPLGLPAAGSPVELDGALSYPAIHLFVERAMAASDTFALAATNVALVRQLCDFLDGMPLAIELAAARVGTLGLQGLLLNLERAFELLTRGRRTAMSRHRTLHAVLSWSYALLTGTQQQVLQRLSIFRGAFDLDAAAAVAACPGLPAAQVREDLQGLLDKSLLTPVPVEGGPLLYRLLYVTRLFAAKALAAGPDEAAVHHRHARLVLHRMVEANQARTGTRHKSVSASRSTRLTSVAAELRTAITWSLIDEHDLVLGIEITAESLHVYHSASLPDEYLTFMTAAIDKLARAGLQDTLVEFKLYQRLAFMSGQMITSAEERERCSRKALELGRRFGTAADRIEALYAGCIAAYGHGDFLQALSCCEGMREFAQGELAPLSVAVADRLSVLSLHALGQHDTAERLAHRVIPFDASTLELRFQTDVPFGVSMRIQLARIHWLRGDFQQAWKTLLESMAQDDGAHLFARCQPLGMAAIPMALWKGDLATAARWSHELLDHATRASVPYWQAFAKAYLGLIDGRPSAQGSPEAALIDGNPLLADIVATLQPGPPRPATLARVHAGQVGWCAPEVLRRAALAQLDPQDDGSRARCLAALRRAMALSVEQGARFWSLRIANSLFAASAAGSAEQAGAREQIQALLTTIDNGSTLPDLQQARLMVEPLDLPVQRPARVAQG